MDLQEIFTVMSFHYYTFKMPRGIFVLIQSANQSTYFVPGAVLSSRNFSVKKKKALLFPAFMGRRANKKDIECMIKANNNLIIFSLFYFIFN